MRLWRSAPRFDPARGSVRTFLFTLARQGGRRSLAPPPRRAAVRRCSSHEALADDDAFEALLVSLDVREALDELSAEAPRGARAALPRRPDPAADQRAAGRSARHGQDPHATTPCGRSSASSRSASSVTDRRYASPRPRGVPARRAHRRTERARFERHLETCAACRAELLELRRPARLLARAAPRRDALPRRARGADVRGDRARGERAAAPVLAPAPRRRRRPRVAALAAVAAAAARSPSPRARGSTGRRAPSSSRATLAAAGGGRRGDRRGAEDRDRPRDPLRQRRAADPARRASTTSSGSSGPGDTLATAEPHLRRHVPPGRGRALARALRRGGRPGQVSRC